MVVNDFDAELAARHARLAYDALGVHPATCERCRLAFTTKVDRLVCDHAVRLARRYMRSMAVALYYTTRAR